MFLKKKKSITHCFVLHEYLKQAKKTWLIFDFSSPLVRLSQSPFKFFFWCPVGCAFKRTFHTCLAPNSPVENSTGDVMAIDQ